MHGKQRRVYQTSSNNRIALAMGKESLGSSLRPTKRRPSPKKHERSVKRDEMPVPYGTNRKMIPGQFEDAEEGSGGMIQMPTTSVQINDNWEMKHGNDLRKESGIKSQSPLLQETGCSEEDNDDDILEIWNEHPAPNVVSNKSTWVRSIHKALSTLHLQAVPRNNPNLQPMMRQLGSSRGMYRGTCRRGLGWRSQIGFQGIKYHLGDYASEEDAAVMYTWAYRIVLAAMPRIPPTDPSNTTASAPTKSTNNTHTTSTESPLKDSVIPQEKPKETLEQRLGSLQIQNLPSDISPMVRRFRQQSEHDSATTGESSAFVGVRRSAGQWHSSIHDPEDGRCIALGAFDSEWLAGAMYTWARRIVLEESNNIKQDSGRPASPTQEQPLSSEEACGDAVAQTAPSERLLHDTSTKAANHRSLLLPRLELQREMPDALDRLQQHGKEERLSIAPRPVSLQEHQTRSKRARNEPPTREVSTFCSTADNTESRGHERANARREGDEEKMSDEGEENTSSLPYHPEDNLQTQHGEMRAVEGRASVSVDDVVPTMTHPAMLLLSVDTDHCVGEGKQAQKALPKHPPVRPARANDPSVHRHDLTDRDIVMGRGGFTMRNPGNRWFLAVVSRYRSAYTKLPRFDKHHLACTLVNYVRCKGGRFLEEAPLHRRTLFYEVGDQRAIAKTSQALRPPTNTKHSNCVRGSTDGSSTGSSAGQKKEHATSKNDEPCLPETVLSLSNTAGRAGHLIF